MAVERVRVLGHNYDNGAMGLDMQDANTGRHAAPDLYTPDCPIVNNLVS